MCHLERASLRAAIVVSLALAAIAAMCRAAVPTQQTGRSHTWSTAPWTGDDAAFHQIRSGLDRDLSTLTPARLLARAKALEREPPIQDRYALFAWAYTLFRAAQRADGFGQRIEFLDCAHRGLSKGLSPDTTEQARLHFLIDVYVAYAPSLRFAGERLLKADPQDLDVRYAMVQVLEWSPALADRRKAVVAAKAFVSAFPREPKYRNALANAHLYVWRKTGNVADGKRAVEAYQDYLRHVPPSHPEVPWTQHLIAEVQKEIAKKAGG